MAALLLSTVVFLQFSFVQLYGEDTFDCTNHEDDSYHPMYDVDNCRYYWHCIYVDTVYMRAVKRVCPAGTEFDVGLRECEISSLVNCIPMKSLRTMTSPEARKWISTVPFSITTKKHRLLPQEKPADVTTAQTKVLSITPSQLTTVFSFEHLFKNFSAILSQYRSYKQESSEDNTTVQPIHTTLLTTAITPLSISAIKKRLEFKHRQIGYHRRNNKTLYILTSNEHKIRQFSINQTRGILLSCNEIGRRQFRDLIFRNTTTTSIMIENSSSKIFDYYILSLIIFIISFLFLQK